MSLTKTMPCPQCGAWTNVVSSRVYSVRRIRIYECANLHKFKTVATEVVVPMRQVKKKTVQ